MRGNFEELLELAAIASFDKEIQNKTNRFEHNYIKVNLEKKQQNELFEKILLLPPKGMFVLFSQFCFHFKPSETETFLQIENVKGYLIYYEKLLSDIMGLEEGQLISNESMKCACKTALNEYIKKEFYADDGRIILHQPRKKVGIKNLAKKVAVAAIIATMSFSTMMVTNAEFRERVISWAIETFEKYSIFELQNNETKTVEDLQKYVPSYIPDGFQLDNTITQPSLIFLEYSNENLDFINILMCMSDTRVYTDTEGIHIEELAMFGSTAYYYNKDGVENLIFDKDGFHFEVYGSINKNDLIRVAEGIKK